MQVHGSSEQTFFNFLIFGKSRFHPKKFYNINSRHQGFAKANITWQFTRGQYWVKICQTYLDIDKNRPTPSGYNLVTFIQQVNGFEATKSQALLSIKTFPKKRVSVGKIPKHN